MPQRFIQAIFLFLMCARTASDAFCGATTNDLATIVRCYRELLLSSENPDVSRWIAGISGEGKWADIDYDNQQSGAWPTAEHLRRVRAIAHAVVNESSPLYNDRAATLATGKALGHWVAARYKNPNWWQNDIGVPQYIRDIIVLMNDGLSPELRASAMEVLAQGRLRLAGTGANAVWLAEIALIYGALSGDEARVGEAAARIGAEIAVGGKEGIQRDFSFHQHGQRLQQFHYGRSFFASSVNNAWVLRGTRWAFSEEKIRVLVDYAIEGCAWMSRGVTTVPGTIDRAISRPNALAWSDSRRELRLLLEAAPADASKKIVAYRKAQERGSAAFSGFRAFPHSDFSTYHNNGCSFFLKTVSARTELTESINNENKKGRKLNWGDHYFVRDGREYIDMPPVWNWDLLPGVTSSADTTTLARPAFAGSVSDGRSGATAMDYRANGERGETLSARKFWAAHDGVVVALIGALRAESFSKPVRTALDQCRLRADVTYEDDTGAKTFTGGRGALSGVRWLHHSGLLYLPLNHDEPVSLFAGRVDGSWKSINENHSSEPISDFVFLPVIEHGVSPRGVSTGFVVRPCATPKMAAALSAKPTWRVLRNDAACQAVRFSDGTLMAAFYEPGTITDTNRTLFTADEQCIAIINTSGDAFVSHPSGNLWNRPLHPDRKP